MSKKGIVLLLFLSALLSSPDPILAESRICSNDLYCESDFRLDRRIISRTGESRTGEFNRLPETQRIYLSSSRRDHHELIDNDQSREYRRFDERLEREENYRRDNYKNQGVFQKIRGEKRENIRFDSQYINRHDDNRRREIVRTPFESVQPERVSRNEINPKSTMFNNRRNLDYPHERIEVFPQNAGTLRDYDMRSIIRKERGKDVTASNRRNLELTDFNSKYDRRTNRENYESTLNERTRINSKVLDINDRIHESAPKDRRIIPYEETEKTRHDSRREQDLFVREKIDEQFNREDRSRQLNIQNDRIRGLELMSKKMDFEREQKINNYQENNRQTDVRSTDSRRDHNVNIRRENKLRRYENLNTNDGSLTKLASISSELKLPMYSEKSLTFLMKSSFIAILVLKIIADCDKTQKRWTTTIGGIINSIGF